MCDLLICFSILKLISTRTLLFCPIFFFFMISHVNIHLPWLIKLKWHNFWWIFEKDSDKFWSIIPFDPNHLVLGIRVNKSFLCSYRTCVYVVSLIQTNLQRCIDEIFCWWGWLLYYLSKILMLNSWLSCSYVFPCKLFLTCSLDSSHFSCLQLK